MICATYDQGSIAILPVRPLVSKCIAAVYRPAVALVDVGEDINNPDVRRRVRAAYEESRACLDLFVVDPLQHAKSMIPYALVSSDGDIVDNVEGCVFDGLVATPGAEICQRVFHRRHPSESMVR